MKNYIVLTFAFTVMIITAVSCCDEENCGSQGHRQPQNNSPYKVAVDDDENENESEKKVIKVTTREETIVVYPEFSLESSRGYYAYIYIDPVSKKRFIINEEGGILEISSNKNDEDDEYGSDEEY